MKGRGGAGRGEAEDIKAWRGDGKRREEKKMRGKGQGEATK